MKIYSLLTKMTFIAACASVLTMGMPALATAKPLSENDYLSFNASIRNRAKGEKRFKQVMQIVYGSQDLLNDYFGTRGPTPRQKISLRGPKGSITFRGTGNQNIASLDLNQNARVGSDVLKLVIDNARCQLGNEQPEPCQAEIRVIKGRTGISDRIVASGSNGAEYDSGAKDVSSGWFPVIFESASK
jgi:hypothetical protein